MPESDNHGFIPSSPRRDTAPKSLSAYTLKLLNSQQPINQSVVVVGWVRETKQTNTGVIFQINDGTSQISCSFFPSGPFEEELLNNIEKNNLLKITGTLRTFDNEPSLSVNSIERISDFSYLTYHFLNCILQYKYKIGELKRTTYENKKTSVQSTGNNLREDVLLCFRNNQDENGLHLDLVINMLSEKYKEDEIRNMVNNLLDDCFLFSVDGDNYKTVD
ncbi:Single-stranded DNA-binding replication protein A (RPA), medium (30 kD) subunit [Pseudoloma neurophilia]|uniref:Single-stranded DNA-binding replication protein A (RPA), medium (30 kD) subunit n=1 Tax=Pseudoloma neurophilia TaxID=146866 RepID=A0A0R0M0R5_9MICR|nr:Single-stranded DNA-binding replication protein A (RPA), medium (30 kD) subunit [Pseudoloma neurophilia]